MSTVNPYSPPRAHVSDIDDTSAGVQPVRAWSARGRIGRLRYLAYSSVGYLGFAVLAGVSGGLGAALGPAVIPFGIGLATIVYGTFIGLLSIQRAHDMDWSGWSILLLLVPLVAFVWIFKGGTQGFNRFGAPPPPNNWGVRLLGLILPALFFIGMLAAIALPAYQQYALRAKAAQVR